MLETGSGSVPCARIVPPALTTTATATSANRARRSIATHEVQRSCRGSPQVESPASRHSRPGRSPAVRGSSLAGAGAALELDAAPLEHPVEGDGVDAGGGGGLAHVAAVLGDQLGQIALLEGGQPHLAHRAQVAPAGP